MNESEPKYIIVPGLPNLKEGIADQVTTEISEDPHGFIIRSVERIERENTDLGGLFLSAALTSPDRPVSLAFMTGYYELYSRSADSEGIPMMIVTGETLNEYRKEEIVEAVRAFAIGSSAERVNLAERLKEQMDINIEKDRQRSEELSNFWDYFEAVEESFREEGLSDDMIMAIFFELGALQSILHQQDEKNRKLQAGTYRGEGFQQ